MNSNPKAKVGDRIRLTVMSDEWPDLKPGALGTVRMIDDLKTVHVDWDNGLKLGLIPNVDEYEVLFHDPAESEDGLPANWPA